jgi:phosphatidylinositol alpha-1,6-mannosyltransferase
LTTLLITEIFPPKKGGSGRWFWETYRRLPRSSYLIAAGEDPCQEAFDRTHDLRIMRLPLTVFHRGLMSIKGWRDYVRGTWLLRRLVARERVAMIHCGRFVPEGVMALALKVWAGVPYACYVHGEELTIAPVSREYCWLARQVLPRASFIVANCQNTARILRDAWSVPADRIRQLYPGVDTHQFAPAMPDPATRADLGWGQRPVILTVGRLQRRKGHDQLILALHAIRQAAPEVLDRW